MPAASGERSGVSTATDKIEEEQDEGNDEQEMNQTSGDMKRESTAPKDHKKYGDN